MQMAPRERERDGSRRDASMLTEEVDDDAGEREVNGYSEEDRLSLHRRNSIFGT